MNTLISEGQNLKLHLHETTEDLLGVIIDSRVSKTDAGAIEGSPGTPLQLKHTESYALWN